MEGFIALLAVAFVIFSMVSTGVGLYYFFMEIVKQKMYSEIIHYAFTVAQITALIAIACALIFVPIVIMDIAQQLNHVLGR